MMKTSWMISGVFYAIYWFMFRKHEWKNATRTSWWIWTENRKFTDLFFWFMISNGPQCGPAAMSRRVWPRGVSWLVQRVMSMHYDSWDEVYGCVSGSNLLPTMGFKGEMWGFMTAELTDTHTVCKHTHTCTLRSVGTACFTSPLHCWTFPELHS